MKRHIFKAIFLSLTILAIPSCNDDPEFNKSKENAEKYNEICSTLNKNIISLQKIINAVNAGERLISYSDVKENGDRIGYELVFPESGSISLYKSFYGTYPDIAIKKNSNDTYYYEIEGKKVNADGPTPQFKIEKSYWYVSYDGNKNWAELCKVNLKATDPLIYSIKEIIYVGVSVTLANGSDILISEAAKTDIIFDDDSPIGIVPGGSKELEYIVVHNNTSDVVVKAFAQNGWEASVFPSNNTNGTSRI